MMRPSYDTDLTDEQWLKISSLYPEANHRGRPRTQDFREITNAILYLVRAGCAWRLLPHDFPKWQTVYYSFRVMAITILQLQLEKTQISSIYFMAKSNRNNNFILSL